MSKLRVWATSVDGTIEYVSLTKERLAEVVDVVITYFFPYENLNRAVGLPDKPEAFAELLDVPTYYAKDGVSVVAIDKRTGKVAGALLNKIRVKNKPTQEEKEFLEKIKTPEVLKLLEITRIAVSPDPLTVCNVDCLMELKELVVLPEYSKRGIGLKLCEVSIELATQLYKGKNVKTSVDGSQLPLEPRPKIVTSLFTTFKTQNIGRKLNFNILRTINYEELFYEGKSFASIIGTETKECTSEYKILE